MFSDMLKRLRKLRQLTQTEISDKLNVTQGSIANWENGTRLPSIDMIPSICRALDVSADTLLEMQPMPEYVLTPDESQLLAAYRAAPPDIQQFTLNALSPYLNAKKAARA